MLHLLRKGDIVVADRYFSSFADLAPSLTATSTPQLLLPQRLSETTLLL